MEHEQLYLRVINEVRAYTMVPPENLVVTMRLAIEAIEAGRLGDFIECGTWMGGSSFAMLLVQRFLYGKILKPVWMFDSFQGLPKADERDGPLSFKYQSEPEATGYFDNCTAQLDKVQAARVGFGFTGDEAIIVPGWFNETIPVHRLDLSNRRISVLRVDCDWYEPVRYVLNELTPFVSNEGAIILDDYYAWDGCARATHDFLSTNSFSWRIRSMDKFYGAWMVKRPHRSVDL